MNRPKQRTIFFLWILFLCLPVVAFSAQNSQIAKPTADGWISATAASTKIDTLDVKVDLLEKINNKLLKSVYWTLGTLALIFLGLISVNLYFNISANKREINKIKEDAEQLTKSLIAAASLEISNKNTEAIKTEIARTRGEITNITTSLIKTSEANLTEKTNVATQREIEKSAANISNIIKNEILTLRTEIDKRLETSAKEIALAIAPIKELSEKIAELEIDVKELKVYKYSQQGKMGAIIGQIELLEYDIKNRPWNLKYRLPEIEKELEGAPLNVADASKLKKLLADIKESDYKELAKKIGNKIVVKEPKDSGSK